MRALCVTVLCIAAVLATPEIKDRLATQGVEARGGKADEFAAFLRAEIPK